MLNFYKRLSHNDKVQFWQIVTNVFLVIFTFWMGLSVQKMVIDDATKFNDNKTRVDYILTIYNNIASKQTFIQYAQILQTASQSGIKEAAVQASDWAVENIDVVISDAKDFVKSMNIFRYYVDPEDYNTIRAHNSAILLLIKLIESYNTQMSESNNEILLTKYIHSEEYILNVGFYLGEEIPKLISELEDLNSQLLSQDNISLQRGSSTVYGTYTTQIFLSMFTSFSILKEYLEPTNKTFKLDKDSILILVLGIIFIIFFAYNVSKLISSRVNVVSETDYKELKFKLGSYSAAYNGQECRIAELQKAIEARNNTIEEYKELIKVWKEEYESLKEQIPSSNEQ